MPERQQIQRHAATDALDRISRYADFIKSFEKTVFTDSCLGSLHKKDKTAIVCTDNYGNSTHRKEMSSLHITDFAECRRVYANLVMTSNEMNGWTA